MSSKNYISKKNSFDLFIFQPELLAAHRDYLQKFNLIELSQELTGKRTHLTLFLFSDCIEVNQILLKNESHHLSI